MILHKHKNYAEYVAIQTKINKKKLNNVWVTEKELKIMADYISTVIRHPKRAICHGSRNGWEVIQFRNKFKGLNAIGTDISDTAKNFPHTIQWDFHKIKPSWVNKIDFIYSNSLDHSYDPILCIHQWMKCLKPNGLCLIHWSKEHGEKFTDKADCFGASLSELKKIIKDYTIAEILHIKDGKRKSYILVIQKKLITIRPMYHDWLDKQFSLFDKHYYSLLDSKIVFYIKIILGKLKRIVGYAS